MIKFTGKIHNAVDYFLKIFHLGSKVEVNVLNSNLGSFILRVIIQNTKTTCERKLDWTRGSRLEVPATAGVAPTQFNSIHRHL
jgi:hypothetical protein